MSKLLNAILCPKCQTVYAIGEGHVCKASTEKRTTVLTEAKDEHDEFWGKIEEEVQKVALLKDPTFRLRGTWKELIRVDEDGFKLCKVDVHWIRHNLNANFGHGGHGFVYEFIPLDEIWASGTHSLCVCLDLGSKEGDPVSEAYLESTFLHEIVEFKEMRDNKLTYWEAHQIALQAEIEAGLLKDPYKEND